MYLPCAKPQDSKTQYLAIIWPLEGFFGKSGKFGMSEVHSGQNTVSKSVLGDAVPPEPRQTLEKGSKRHFVCRGRKGIQEIALAVASDPVFKRCS